LAASCASNALVEERGNEPRKEQVLPHGIRVREHHDVAPRLLHAHPEGVPLSRWDHDDDMDARVTLRPLLGLFDQGVLGVIDD
jgi:hypothetical protein